MTPSPSIATYAEANEDLQRPFDVAVVMPSVVRPELRDALQSIFRQDLDGRVQVLIGVDAPLGDPAVIGAICNDRPPNCTVQVFYPGYSTSVRHGGLSPARDGGALRCVLSFIANSNHVAYLDDDNWWAPDHLRLLRQALAGADWAFSLRWFVHHRSRRPICIDRWESVGPGAGVFLERFGGFVDPSCLMLDRSKCEPVLALWNRPIPGDPNAMSADRSVFHLLRQHFRWAGTNQPTVFYEMDADDGIHPFRLKLIGADYDRDQ